MLKMRLSDIALWTHGSLRGADTQVDGVGIDSRSIRPGQLFVALPGEHSDGHDHVGDAAAHGASSALVSHRVDCELAQVVVADTLLALGDLASTARAEQATQVIGITGSNGKTTVKALTAAILSRHARTHVNPGNYNNEIGLPLSLLGMPADSTYAVLEMGAGKPGDISYLAAIARPQIGLVNNIAPAHLERMKSVTDIAHVKGALYEALPADGTAIINADDDFAEYFSGLVGARRVLRFGMQPDNDISAQDIDLGAEGSRFRLCTPYGDIPVQLPLPGTHNVANAMAAAAIACALDVPLADIAAGLAQAQAVPGRLVVHAMPGDWQLIDDSYNANPASVRAAIETLVLMPGEAWLVLGDMAELGPDAGALHVGIGDLASKRGVARLWTVGTLSAAASTAFGAGGEHFADQQSLVAALREQLHPGVNCLVKGSRSAAMEKVVATLGATRNGGHTHAA